MSEEIAIVTYRTENGWKCKCYLGTEEQIQKRINRLKFSDIDINRYPPTQEHIEYCTRYYAMQTL